MVCISYSLYIAIVTRFVEEDLPKSIFMRRAGEEPLLLSDTAITAMEEGEGFSDT